VRNAASKAFAALATGVLTSGAINLVAGFSALQIASILQAASPPADEAVTKPSAFPAEMAPWWTTQRHTEGGADDESAVLRPHPWIARRLNSTPPEELHRRESLCAALTGIGL
jgi:hypothetical protein